MKKLKKILLINWLYFSKQLIEVEDVNFLTGKNGAGKSTIIDALQIVLLGETNARNFNQAANEKSQRTLDGYLRADMDENNPSSRRGKDFSSYIVCEFLDDVEGKHFVSGIVFDCRSDGGRQDRFFIYDGTIPKECFIQHGEAFDIPMLRSFLKTYGVRAKIYDTHKQYQVDLLAKWNVHNEQVMRMMKKAVSFRPIVDIQQFITENICDIPEKPNIEVMQQNIRDYKRHELLAQRQEEKLSALQEISQRYREMQQAIERWRIHFFLTLWAQKEAHKSQIYHLELDKKKHAEQLEKIEQQIKTLCADIEQKETRRRELDLACAQSSVYQEEEKLSGKKKVLIQEQQKLIETLQNLALEIKREAARVNHLCTDILSWDAEGILAQVQECAKLAQKAYAVFDGAGYELFKCPLSIFEAARDTMAALDHAIRTAVYQIENQLVKYRAEKQQKQNALTNLRRNIKDYPRGLLLFQKRLAAELKQQMGYPVELPIVADVLEITEECWRGAVEGYLNTQKFYLLVDPAYYREALIIYHKIKQEFGSNSFGIVDIAKLREKERLEPWEDSLAKKVETQNDLARSYMDYLLGRVVCCAHVEQLRKYRTAITADGMLYQGYVARPLRRELMEDVFIGRRAVELRIQRLETELSQIEAYIQKWEPVFQVLRQQTEPLFHPFFVQNTVKHSLDDYVRGLEITKEIAQIDEQLSQLDLLWLSKQQKIIDALSVEIKQLSTKKDESVEQQGKLKEKIKQLEQETLPEYYRQLSVMEERLQEEFSQEYLEQVGIPRYQQELTRLQNPSIVYKNFLSRISRSILERDQAKECLMQARHDYSEQFKPCSFQIDAMDNVEYEEEQRLLEDSEILKYRTKMKEARESAMEQFQNDFLSKLKSSIDQVREQVRNLNKALKQAQFGTDRYQFRVDRNPDYADYYDMIMAPELMEGEGGLFALPFQQKYGKLIEELFSQIAMSDDAQVNARRQSELQQNIEKFTDFRTYLKFDLETTDQNGSRQLLSQTLNTKSGGETQTPFYIAVLASFTQMYQVNNPSSLASNTIRLVVFDEAFNKMDSDRIVESVRLLRKMGLQAIICTPPDKLPDIMPQADRTHLVIKEKYRMHVRSWGKEILPT